MVTVPAFVKSFTCSEWYLRASSSVMPTLAITSFCVTRAMSICRSSVLCSSGSDIPSCFSAAWKASSVSSLFSLRMFWTTRSKSSSVIL